MYLIGMIKGIVTIVALLLGAGLAVFVFVQFSPKLQLRIIQRWVDEINGLFVLKLEVENISRIRVYKQKIQLQILEHEVPANGCLSEWVPFDEEEVLSEEKPKEWHAPIEVFESSKFLNPGEILSVERLCHCPHKSVVHVGLQVKVKLGVLGCVASCFRSWKEQWTSTIIVMRSQERL